MRDCAGNPINYIDPTGHVIETLVDAGSVIWSTVDLIREPSWENLGYLAWDAGATIVPFVPGSYTAKGVKASSKLLTGSKKTNKIKKTKNFIRRSPFAKLLKSGHIDPRKVRFTQNSIAKSFSKGGASLEKTIALVKKGAIKMDAFPAIRIFEMNGKMFTLDNRRLYVAKQAGVKLKYRKATKTEITNELGDKLTTKNNGTSIRVRK